MGKSDKKDANEGLLALVDKMKDMKIVAQNRPKLPKGKRNAYQFFLTDQSIEMKSKGQKSCTLPLLQKHCSAKWKEMSTKEKEKYNEKADEDKSRYKKEMIEFTKSKKKFDSYVDEVHDKGLLRNLNDETNFRRVNKSDVVLNDCQSSDTNEDEESAEDEEEKDEEEGDDEEEEEDEEEDEEGDEEEGEDEELDKEKGNESSFSEKMSCGDNNEENSMRMKTSSSGTTSDSEEEVVEKEPKRKRNLTKRLFKQ